jgi:glycosyltransferase involved in cell wall biosynthesis
MDKVVSFNQVVENPFISVVLPVYNAALYLDEAIQSILNQTFTDFELLIFNDASTDDSDKIIRSYSDSRIIYEKMDSHSGLVLLLNKGLEQAKGKYIARMDADDICMPTRFEEQVAFMESNPIVGICGTWFENFGKLSGIVKQPILEEEVQLSFFSGTPLGHPTVMMRRSMLEQFHLRYNNDFLYNEDYELFERASAHFAIINIPKVLLQYRKHSTQITSLKWQHQYFLTGKVQARRFLRTLHDVNANDIKWMEDFFTGKSLIDDDWFAQLGLYKKRILSENIIYPAEILKRAVESLFPSQREKTMYSFFFNKYYAQKKFNLPLLIYFLKDNNKPWIFLGKKLSFYFAIKCFLLYHKNDNVSN